MQNKELKKNSTKLLECPFCGGEVKWANALHNFIECMECDFETIWYETEAEAIKAWNTRKPMDRIVEQIEGMFGVDPMYYGEEVKWAVDKAIEIVKEGGKDVTTRNDTGMD